MLYQNPNSSNVNQRRMLNSHSIVSKLPEEILVFIILNSNIATDWAELVASELAIGQSALQQSGRSPGLANCSQVSVRGYGMTNMINHDGMVVPAILMNTLFKLPHFWV